METARDRLHDMGEHISPDRFSDLILNALTPDYNFVRDTSFRDREFGLGVVCTLIFPPVRQANHRLQGVVSPWQAHVDLHGVKCYIYRPFRSRKESFRN